MARKQKFELDEFGFDKSLDIDIPDFDIKPPKDDRSPITKAATGAFHGAKDTAFSNQFVRKFLKDALPKGYGDAMDSMDQGLGEASKLYNSTLREIKPTIKELKKVTNRIIPRVEGKLPKGIVNKLKDWSKQDEQSSQADYRESGIQFELASIFAEQMKQDDANNQKEEVREAQQEVLDKRRHGDLVDQLNSIRLSTTRLASYQDKVTIGFQRKSLELQYRQYYLAADLLEEQKRSNEQFKANLAEIVKNTGLPDFVKLSKTESLGTIMRNKFMNNIYDSVFDSRRGYVGKVVGRLGNKIKDKITGFASDVQSGIAMADTAMDTSEMAAEMGGGGLDPYEVAGSAVGGMAMDSLGGKLGKRVGNVINSSRFGRKVRTVGNDLEYGVKNLPQLGDKFAKGDYDYDTGITGKIIGAIGNIPGGQTLIDALKEAARSEPMDKTMKVDAIKDMQAPAVFSNQTRKSINEVIPGFLARIYQELQILRTGDQSVGLVTYDHGSNKFVGAKELFKSTIGRIVSKDQTDRFKQDNDELINHVDPNGKLSKRERTELGRFFLNDNLQNGLGDPKRFADASEYKDVKKGTAEKAAKLFAEAFGIDEFGEIADKEEFSKKRVQFANKYSGLGSSFGDSRSTIQDILNLGHHDILKQADLVDERGQLNTKQLNKMMAGYRPRDFNGPLNNGPVSTGPIVPQVPPSGIQNQRPPVPPTVQPTPVAQPQPAPQPAPVVPQPMATNNGFDQDKFDQFSTDTLTVQKQILEAINNANTVEIDKQFVDIATRIETAIQNVGTGQGGGSGTGGDPRNKRWYEASIGDLIGSITTGVSNGISFAGDQVAKVAKGITKLGAGAFGMATSMAKKGTDWLMKKAGDFSDVYIRGEAVPRIQAWRLKAGHYYDQKTGQVIRKFSDIKGAIVDKDGNIVLSLEDMKNIVPPDMRNNAKKAIDGLISLGKKAATTVGGVYGSVIAGGMQALKFAKSSVMKALARDVYVVGEDTPRLLAITMRSGGYRSKLTGKVIWRPLSIDGPVLNTDGEIVLTDADLRKGIVDSQGKPFRSIVSRIMDFGKKVVKTTVDTAIKGVKMGAKAAKWAVDKASDMGSAFLDMVKNGFPIIGGKTIVDRLTEIRDLLKDRLPEKKKAVAGDTDGDGDRENSWQDMDQKRAALEKAAKEAKAKGTGIGAAGAAAAANRPEDQQEEDGGGYDLSDIQSGWDMAKGAGKRIKGWGGKLLGKGKGLLGKIPGSKLVGKIGLKGAGKLLGVAGAAYGAYSAYDNFNKGNYGEAALDTGLTAGGLALSAGGVGALATGATAAGSGILAGLGTVAAGVGSVLASPVVLGALAVGAVGVGAYYGYKYLTRKKLETLSTYRFAQYGFNDKDTDFLPKVFGLEDKLEKSVQYGRGGATLKDDVPIKDMLDLFGINPNDQNMVIRFTRWFQYRFKPVYLTHMTALNNIAPGTSLADVDSKLKPEEKQKYFQASRFEDGPYAVTDSPVTERNSLTVGPNDVSNVGRITEEAIKKELTDGKSSDTGIEDKSTVAKAAATATAGVVGTAAMKQTGAKPDDPGVVKQALAADGNKGTLRAGLNAALSTTAFSETGMGPVSATDVVNTEKQISPLNAIRYRSYGLYELEIPKINNLLTLEQAVIEEMKFTGEDVEWNGNIEDIIARCGGKFGVSDYNTRAGQNFSMWFNGRFMPIFTNYVRTVYSLTGKKNVREATKLLTPSQILTVANAIYTTKTTYQGRSNTPIWAVAVSPWADYVINTNEATVHDGVKALSEKAKGDVVKEVIPSKKADALTQPSLDTDKNNQQAQKNTGLWDKTKDLATKAGGWIADKAGKAWDLVKTAGSGIMDASTTVASKAREYGSKALGAAATAIGSFVTGTGGLIDQIPMPKASGTWDALKDTINAAAKMVGMDEKLMAVIAAIESGFNTTAKAGTSSATGLFQFIKSTWDYMVKNYGPKYGIGPNTPPSDPRANALMGGEFLKMNMTKIAPVLGRAPTYTDLYLAHFLGDGGAKKFIQAMNQNPGQGAADIFPKESQANKTIFFEPSGRPRSLQDVYSHFTSMINQKAKAFKIDVASAPAAANDSSVKGPALVATTTTATPANATQTNKPAQPVTPAAPVTPVAQATAQATGKSTGPGTPPAAPSPSTPGVTLAAVATSKTAEMIAKDSAVASKQPTPGPSNTGPTILPTASPIQAGFNMLQAQQLTTQVKTSKEDFNNSIGSIDKTLTESLTVQKASRDLLAGILKEIQRNGGVVKMPNAAEPQSQPSQKGFIKSGQRAEMPTAPVPMAKSA